MGVPRVRSEGGGDTCTHPRVDGTRKFVRKSSVGVVFKRFKALWKKCSQCAVSQQCCTWSVVGSNSVCWYCRHLYKRGRGMWVGRKRKVQTTGRCLFIGVSASRGDVRSCWLCCFDAKVVTPRLVVPAICQICLRWVHWGALKSRSMGFVRFSFTIWGV